MTALLTVEGVTKNFNNRRVLDDVRFSVRPGEVLGLIGPNGSGNVDLFKENTHHRDTEHTEDAQRNNSQRFLTQILALVDGGGEDRR